MKTLLMTTGIILTLSIAGLTSLTVSKAGKTMTQTDVLREVSAALESTAELKLQKVGCTALYGDESPESRRCYASAIEPETMSVLLAKALKPLADTAGWTKDYAVPGAFYQMKADPKMTFGMTVKGIQGSLDLGEVKELKGLESYVTLTVNSQRKD